MSTLDGADSAQLCEVLDIVLEDEEIGRAFAGQSNKRVVVIFDRSCDFFAVNQFHAHRRAVLDEVLQIADLLQRLFRRPRRSFALLSRIRFSYLFFRVSRGSTETPASFEEDAV